MEYQWICAQCKHQNPGTMKFCPHCGAVKSTPIAQSTSQKTPLFQGDNRRWWIGSGIILILICAILAVSGGLLLGRRVADNNGDQPSVVETTAPAPVVTPSPVAEIVLSTRVPPADASAPTRAAPLQSTATLAGDNDTAQGDQLSLPTATPTSHPTTPPAPSPTLTPVRSQSEGLGVGNIAPDFTVGNTRESRISLSDLRGKVVILNFWATWCPPCRSEVPALQAVHNEFGPQGVVVLAVNVKEKVETVSRYAWDNGIGFNVWLDEDGWVSTIYGVRSIPITYFIDAQGVIRAVHFGAMNREQITAQLQKML